MDNADEFTLSSTTSWLTDPNAQAVCRMIAAGGHQVLFVGGCVRNALLNTAASDVDISTDALPEKVVLLAQEAGLKALPTGIDHGTITVISGGEPFEITTFRRDVATDGRRAVVAFSDNITDDALRRDFTMNALYATPEGKLVDPLGGLSDLRARRIRFIEDPHARIQEDYLRILRFFRFFAWYGRDEEGFDTDAMDAIAQNTAGIEIISAERVGHEMRKLLAAPDPTFAVAGMRNTGVLQTLLPGADDRWLGLIAHAEAVLGLSPNWLRRLASLGGTDIERRLRLSKAECRAHVTLREVGFGPMHEAEIAYRYGETIAQSSLLLRAALSEKVPDVDALAEISAATLAQFPVTASDLMPDFEGAALGKKLAELEQIWINSDFTLEKSELLNHG